MGQFNENQLATLEAAKLLADKLTTAGVGDGVAPVVDDQKKSGIYRPEWLGGPAAFPEPGDGDAKFYHFRFNNGAEGINVGLNIQRFKNYSEAYALQQIKAEVDQEAAGKAQQEAQNR